jgi:hypothetical protein
MISLNHLYFNDCNIINAVFRCDSLLSFAIVVCVSYFVFFLYSCAVSVIGLEVVMPELSFGLRRCVEISPEISTKRYGVVSERKLLLPILYPHKGGSSFLGKNGEHL